MRAIGLGAVLLSVATVMFSAPAARAQGGDQQVGSVLLYTYYRSSGSSPATDNTRFAMTNTGATIAYVQLFFVRATGAVEDSTIILVPKQTAAFLATDVEPGERGYLLAVSVDDDGCPLGSNVLMGDAYVKAPTGHTANLGAVAFKALFTGTLSGCSPSSTTATLNFDGVSYERAPRVVAIDKIASPADGNSTLLVLNRFGGDLTMAAPDIGMGNGQLFDSGGTPHDFTFSAADAQLASTLSNSFPMTTPVFNSVIPAGTTGWMKVFANSDFAVTGAVLNYNPNSGAAANAFSGGHNLRALSLTESSSYVIPITDPTP